MEARDNPAARAFAGGMSRRQFLAVVSLFWLYVTLSNVLYAYSMRTGIAAATNVPLFAHWNARVMQHALLLPMLAISYWASLRVGWRPIWVAIPLQIVLGVVFAAVAYPAMIVAQITLDTPEFQAHAMGHASASFDPALVPLWMASFVSFVPAYGFGLALVTGLALYTRFQKSELRVAALEREWSAARLTALRMQLSPHTLFNLLHTIRGHIEWDPQGAQSMVVQLADLLRRLLSAGERDFTRLTDELQFVKHYLELQQRRFADRLTVMLPEPADLPGAWVPSLIMQPLVENAVVHGLSGHQGPVLIRVSVDAGPDTLTLRVRNSIAPERVPGEEGIGVSNVRERLAVQFEGRASLIAGSEGTEWVSEITMPLLRDSPGERRMNRTAGAVVGSA